MLYSLELHKDSLFTLSKDREANQLELSRLLYRNFQAQVEEMSKILEEYNHLLEHDNFDCSTHLSGEKFMFKCWFRRYGFPLICLILFALFGAWRIHRAFVKEKSRLD